MTAKDRTILNYLSEGFTAKEISVKIGATTHHTEYLIKQMRKEYKAKNVNHLLTITKYRIMTN